jgi:hypothetical protein
VELGWPKLVYQVINPGPQGNLSLKILIQTRKNIAFTFQKKNLDPLKYQFSKTFK